MSEENRPYPEGIAGMSDEHGMPVPTEQIPTPLWIDREQFVDTVRDKHDEEVNLWDMPEFFVHAANWIVPCREIVRRLAELGSIGDRALMYQLVEDAAKLWDEMKGAGDES